MAKPLPPLKRLHHCFEIDETSPSKLRWKNATAHAVKNGDVAGRKNSGGYWEVSLDAVRYKVHRIIYYMQTGEDPIDFDIDHRFGDLNDNANVRKVTKSQNLANSKPRKNCSSKYKGVYKSRNTWCVEIQVRGKRIYVGRFRCEKEAALAYNKAAIENFGEFAWINDLQESVDSDQDLEVQVSAP
jgi:hypothetical protein